MDIPENRRPINFGNLSWLARNMVIRNRNHPDFKEAWCLVIKLFKEETKGWDFKVKIVSELIEV